jgi:molybdopterin synthase catalytic subunit
MAVKVQPEAFDSAAETAGLLAGRTDVGGVVSFTGYVRGDVGGRQLRTLTLEHYPGMTEAELARIESEAQARFALLGSLVVHRIGVLAPGEPIVLVIAAARHREAAFEAASFLMDYLKSRAPFWKKESFADGGETWVDARESDQGALDRWASATQK